MTFDSWENMLCHSGTKGMRWGIRRYQNEDGSLTPEGRKRYLKNGGEKEELNWRGKRGTAKLIKSRNSSDNEAASRLIKSLNKNVGKEDPNEEKEKIESNLFSNKNKEARALVKTGFSKSIRKQARSMSSEELKKAVERLNLEKQYSDLMKQQNKGIISVGAEVAGNIIRKSIDNIGTQWTTYGLGKAANKLVGQDVVNPRKGQKDK